MEITHEVPTALVRGGLALAYPTVLDDGPPREDNRQLFEFAETTPRAVVLVGEGVELRWTVRPNRASIDLARAPQASGAQLTNMRFCPDVPGVYVFRASLGPWSRELVIASWRRDDLLRLGKAPPKGKPDPYYLERRQRVQMLVNDPRVTAASLVASLEGNESGCWGFDGTMFGTPGINGVSITGW